MRAKHEILAKEIIAVFQPVLVTNPQLRSDGIRKLGMLGCLAMKDGSPGSYGAVREYRGCGEQRADRR